MLCQNHTSLGSWLDGAEHSYSLESAQVFPPIKLVFLTLLLITDKNKSAPTCDTQTSCKSALPCLCGRRMFPGAWEESCCLSWLLVMLFCGTLLPGLDAEGRAVPMVLRDVRKFSFHHLFLRKCSPPKIRENQMPKILVCKRKATTHSCGIKGQLLCGDESAVACVL